MGDKKASPGGVGSGRAAAERRAIADVNDCSRIEGTTSSPRGQALLDSSGLVTFNLPVARARAVRSRLSILSARTGLSFDLILESLVLGCDVQLLRVCAALTPGAIASGWRRGRMAPVEFVVAEAESEVSP